MMKLSRMVAASASLACAVVALAAAPGAATTSRAGFAAPASSISGAHLEVAAAPVGLSPAMNRLASSTAAAVVCARSVTLQSRANGRYVSTELGWGGDNFGMLRARATVVGPWERYTLCRDTSTNLYTITSDANSQLVSTELGWSGDRYGMLRARATAVGPWEQYYVIPFGSDLVIQSAANGQYVSAELGWGGDNYGMLRARATAVGPWERFGFG